MPRSNRSSFLPELTLDQVREGLQHTFPDLAPDLHQLRLLKDGFSSYVVLVADEKILRIAKHAEAMAGHTRELAVLPLLRKHLPVRVPEPIWRAGPSECFPFGVLGYRIISGVPFSLRLVADVSLNHIAQDIAQFLVALHDIPRTEISSLDLTAAFELERLLKEVLPTIHAHLTKDEYRRIEVWWDTYRNDPVKDSFTPKLIHGDPWGENIILNESLNRVVGVIDFETVSIGDVAQDFAAQKYLRAGFTDQVMEHYQKLGGTLEDHFAIRLQGRSMVRELTGLRHAIRYPQSGELMDSLQKVRNEMGFFA